MSERETTRTAADIPDDVIRQASTSGAHMASLLVSRYGWRTGEAIKAAVQWRQQRAERIGKR